MTINRSHIDFFVYILYQQMLFCPNSIHINLIRGVTMIIIAGFKT